MRLFFTALTAAVLTAVSAAAPPADLIVTNAAVVTMDPVKPRAAAVACRGGRVAAVGSVDEIGKLRGPKTKVIDAGGAFVMPGFIEAHGHFVGLGQSKMMLDLRTAETWAAIVAQVEAAAAKLPKGAWVVGRGWHQAKWSSAPVGNIDGYPVHDALSAATPDNPVLLTHASGHMAIANAAAMKLGGVTKKTPNPPGGEILRDDSGEPIGVLREKAQGLVSRALSRARSRMSAAERRAEVERAVRLAETECLSHGVTSFHDAGSPFRVVDELKRLAEADKLRVRLYVMIRDSNAALAAKLPRYRLIGLGDNHLTVRALKRSLDGALGPHGAWLLEPYDDLPTKRGLNTQPLGVMRRTAELAVEHDFQFCVHAIGDRANRVTLDLFEEAFRKSPTERSRRWRVEHAQHIHPDDIGRFGKLGVIASVQGIHCTSDAIFVLRRLGFRRAEEGAYVWQKLLKGGARLCNGTDAPVEPIDPIACFYATVTRRLKSGATFFRDQCLSREEALKSYTTDAAYAAFEEDIKGSLTPGKLADLVVLSRDLLTVPDEKIRDTEVLYTVVGGKVLYRK